MSSPLEVLGELALHQPVILGHSSITLLRRELARLLLLASCVGVVGPVCFFSSCAVLAVHAVEVVINLSGVWGLEGHRHHPLTSGGVVFLSQHPSEVQSGQGSSV